MSAARAGHTVTEMPNGMVLIAGGASGPIDAATSVTSIQEFDPSSNTFGRLFNLRTARATHGAALMPDGNLVVFGGLARSTAASTLDTMEIVHQ